LGKGGYVPNSIDRARDELFSHIRRCGVLEAEDDQRSEWFDDTIEYLGERYPELTPDELVALRAIGERYCAPAIPHGGRAAAENTEAVEEDVEEDAEETEVAVATATEVVAEAVGASDEEVIDTGEVSAA
jgi:hypothetical protein